MEFAHAVGFGVVTAAILAIASVALTMQFSVTGVPNFAQGDIMTYSAYAALGSGMLVNNVALQVASACVTGALLSYLLYLGLLRPFARAGAKRLTLFVVMFSTSILLQNVLLAAVGGQTVLYTLPASNPNTVGPFLWTGRDEQIIVVSVLVMLSVHLVLRYTKFGKSQRAVADNPELARVSAINSDVVIGITWLWSGALTGLAGFVLAAQLGSFGPSVGFSFVLVVFASAIVGGIGQVYGAMAGALLIGLAMEVSALYLPAEYKQGIAFLILIVALLLRPDGLFPAPSSRAQL